MSDTKRVTTRYELGPIKLEGGATYVIEFDRLLSMEQHEALRVQLDREEERLNVQFLILTGGLKLAKAGLILTTFEDAEVEVEYDPTQGQNSTT